MATDKMAKTTTLALAAMDPELAVSLDAIAEELGGESIGLALFSKIRIPKGGRSFEIENDDDANAPEVVTSIEGVIVTTCPTNSYFSTPYEEGGEHAAPDCASPDGKVGHGDRAAGGYPGAGDHECATCPLNEFGTNERGGKACSNRRLVMLYRDSDVFPLMLSLSPTMLRSWTTYVAKQLKHGRRASGVVTRVAIEKSGDKTYPVFSYVASLTTDQAAWSAETGRALLAVISDYTPSMIVDKDAAPVIEGEYEPTPF